MSPRRAARVDTSASALVKTARELGAYVVPLNSIVDCLIYWRGVWHVVDWKSPGGHLTPAQQKLVIDTGGAGVKFISTEAQLRELLNV